MIKKAELGRPIFLSVACNDGALEAFDDINEAVAQATDLVKEDKDDEHVIYVAMPRARVHMAVRVEPIEPSSLQPPQTSSVPGSAEAEWETSQGLTPQPNGHDDDRHDAPVPWAHARNGKV